MKSITTSIRLTPPLRKKLEKAAQAVHRSKNWIMSKALEEYLHQLKQEHFAQEARRQSLLASKIINQDEAIWENNVDALGWN